MHRGRIVELGVERTLVAFEAVVDAMECALAIQHGMALRNRACRASGASCCAPASTIAT